MHMVVAINKILNLSGSTKTCSYDAFLSWIISIEGIKNAKPLWSVLFRAWDDEIITNKFVVKIKSMFGVGFPNHQKPGFLVTLLNHSLKQIRKTINNSMSPLCGMTQEKSIVTHKVVGKNYYDKRKK